MNETLQSKVAPRVALGNVVCDVVDYDEAVDRIRGFVRSRRPHLVLTPNLTQVRQASRLPVVARAYQVASMSTPDGWPLAAVVGAVVGRRHQKRVTGADLTPLLCREPFRVGLVGGRGDSAVRAAKTLQRQNEDLDVGLVEMAHPDEVQEGILRQELIARIVEADLDLIFLGVGVPKQEGLALELLPRLDRGVVLCVGASIDFIAGSVRRCPRWVQQIGLEWAYRILREPRRMFVRYAVALPYFLSVAACLFLKGAMQRGSRASEG